MKTNHRDAACIDCPHFETAPEDELSSCIYWNADAQRCERRKDRAMTPFDTALRELLVTFGNYLSGDADKPHTWAAAFLATPNGAKLTAALRRAILEEAAKVCDEAARIYDGGVVPNCQSEESADTCRELAADIRALAEQKEDR